MIFKQSLNGLQEVFNSILRSIIKHCILSHTIPVGALNTLSCFPRAGLRRLESVWYSRDRTSLTEGVTVVIINVEINVKIG